MITKERRNIIVADDSEFFRIKLSDILTDIGHNVKVVGSGIEVVNELKTNPNWVDLLILDIQMPEVDGFEVLKWIKEDYKNNNNIFPILAVTGAYEPSQIIDRLKELGANGLMTKAFTPEQIIFRVNKLLFPEKITMREVPRIPITIPVDFKVGYEVSTGFLLNISETGMFLHMQKELLPGTSIYLRFSLPESERVFDVKGIVRWCNIAGQGKSMFGGCGIQFVSLNPDEQGLIRDFVKNRLDKMS